MTMINIFIGAATLKISNNKRKGTGHLGYNY